MLSEPSFGAVSDETVKVLVQLVRVIRLLDSVRSLEVRVGSSSIRHEAGKRNFIFREWRRIENEHRRRHAG
jgi:hypothetical protein